MHVSLRATPNYVTPTINCNYSARVRARALEPSRGRRQRPQVQTRALASAKNMLAGTSQVWLNQRTFHILLGNES